MHIKQQYTTYYGSFNFLTYTQLVFQNHEEEGKGKLDKSSIMYVDKSKDAASSESSEDPETFSCHQDYDAYMYYVLDLKFWLECVLLSIIGAFGFLGNIITFIVLKGQVKKLFELVIYNKLFFYLNTVL